MGIIKNSLKVEIYPEVVVECEKRKKVCGPFWWYVTRSEKMLAENLIINATEEYSHYFINGEEYIKKN
jgi:hypothetical protein